MSDLSSQPTRSFYGAGCSLMAKQLQRNATLAKQSVIPYVLKDLLNGPCITWKVFKKQEDALNYSKSAKGGLMTFAFEPQDFSTGRLFLSAHPELFWHYDSQRINSERCSYEIIIESAACKLYADLEFDTVPNPRSKGPEMVSIFINIVCKAIFKEWGVRCLREHVLDLDSSTDAKFSRHLIFNLPSACFVNNHHVGIFLKRLSQDVMSSIDTGVVSDNLQGMLLSDLLQLVVFDSKGNTKLFCDLSVYSKNRHFRVYRSTKKGKNAPLLLSKDNTFKVIGELNTFLSSLVTYVSSSCRVLEVKNTEIGSGLKGPRNSLSGEEAAPSPLPIVDKVIGHAVHPGRVHKSYYFASSNVIVYNIVGNRFCGNVNREHKSNNVKFIVDLDKFEYYQKCHDFECSGYRSPGKPLPPEVVFQISDSSDISSPDTLGVFGLSEEEAADVLDVMEAVSSTEFSQFTEEMPQLDSCPKMDIQPVDCSKMDVPPADSYTKMDNPLVDSCPRSRPKMDVPSESCCSKVDIPPLVSHTKMDNPSKKDILQGGSYQKMDNASVDSCPKMDILAVDSCPKMDVSLLSSCPKMHIPPVDCYPKMDDPSEDSCPKMDTLPVDSCPKMDVSLLDSCPKMDIPLADTLDKDASKTPNSPKSTPLLKFPSFGLSDEAFNNIEY